MCTGELRGSVARIDFGLAWFIGRIGFGLELVVVTNEIHHQFESLCGVTEEVDRFVEN